MNDPTPDPREGYLDDDFARFRARKLGIPLEGPPPAAPEEPQTFFGTTTRERVQIRAQEAAERCAPLAPEGVAPEPVRRAKRRPPPPLPRARRRSHTTSRRLRRSPDLARVRGDEHNDPRATC